MQFSNRIIWSPTQADKSALHTFFPAVPVGVVLLTCVLGLLLFLVFRRRRPHQPPEKKEDSPIQHAIDSVRNSTVSSNRVNPLADNNYDEPRHASNEARVRESVRSRSRLNGSDDGTTALHKVRVIC